MVVEQKFKCVISMGRLDTNTSLYGYGKVEAMIPNNSFVNLKMLP